MNNQHVNKVPFSDMTTIEDVKALADDLLCAAAVDEVDSARQKFEDAIEQYAAERVAEAMAVPAPPFDPAFEPPWHRSDNGPAEVRGEPLTDEQIFALADSKFPHWRIDIQDKFVIQLARAIERAHGIGEKQNG